jgi:hypothetical protein
MDQIPLSSWSYTSGQATQLPNKSQTDFHGSLKEVIFAIASWCRSLWCDLMLRMKVSTFQRSDLRQKPLSIRFVRGGQPDIMEKALPLPPASAELGSWPQAPLPLAQRQYLDHSARKLRVRPLTWSETQINNLQEENRKLRNEIISQKRVESDKNHAISMLRQLNSRANRELNRQNEALAQLANMAVAIQSHHEVPHPQRLSTRSPSLDHGALDEVIQIYSNLQPGDWQSDTVQSHGSIYTQHQRHMPDDRAHNRRGHHLKPT